MKRWIPLILFAVLAVFLYMGLYLNPREVPSPFIGKPAPAFQKPQLTQPDRTFSPADMKGQVWLMNVWASWCVSCRAEHEFLMQVAENRRVPIVGLNYKDKEPGAALGWVSQLGNPYLAVAVDIDGRVGIDYGVTGTPETFLIDRNGIIRLKHVGPLNPEVWRDKIEPKLKELNA